VAEDDSGWMRTLPRSECGDVHTHATTAGRTTCMAAASVSVGGTRCLAHVTCGLSGRELVGMRRRGGHAVAGRT
jgi:hypothetical protein